MFPVEGFFSKREKSMKNYKFPKFTKEILSEKFPFLCGVLQILEKQKLKRILLNVDFAKFHGNYDLQITHSDFLFFIFIILTTFESRQDVPVV